MLFAALLRCTYYNGNAIFSGNQSISFAQDSNVRAGLDGSRRQNSTVLAGLDGSRRQNSTVRAGLDGSRRTRRFSQTELDGSRRTRRFAQDSTGFAVSSPFWPLRCLINVYRIQRNLPKSNKKNYLKNTQTIKIRVGPTL